jgi:hypothetical protein
MFFLRTPTRAPVASSSSCSCSCSAGCSNGGASFEFNRRQHTKRGGQTGEHRRRSRGRQTG